MASPVQKRALTQIHTTGSLDGIQERTLAALTRNGHLKLDSDGHPYVTKRGVAYLSGRMGGNLPEVKRADLRKHLRDRKPRKRATRPGDTAKARKAHLEAQRGEFEALELKRGRILGRILGPHGVAHAVKISRADGASFNRDDVERFRAAGWEVVAAGTAAGRVGSGGIPGVIFREDDWIFRNPDTLGPSGLARALVLVGRVNRELVEDLAAEGFDVTAAPKKLREAIHKNPTKKTGFNRYRVKGTSEEFECPNCGEVVWDGETAWESEEHGQVACSKSCLSELTRERGESPFRYHTNPTPVAQKKVYEAMKKAAGKRQALNLDELAQRTKQPVEAVRDAVSKLLKMGLAHVAGRDLFGECYLPGIHQAGLFQNPRPGAKAEKKAKAWYQMERLETGAKTINLPDTVEAVEIGQIVSITYESDKYDGRKRLWKHDVTGDRTLHISTDGKVLVVLPGFKVTKRGIEG